MARLQFQTRSLIPLVHLLITSFSFYAIVHDAMASTSSSGRNFDLQSFLDPQAISAIMPIPVVFPSSHQKNSHIEQRQLSLAPTTAFISRRSFNTSCAFTIPLVTFVLPTQAPYSPDSQVHIGNQMVYSLFFFMYSVACFIVPVVFTGIRDPTITGRSENEGTAAEALMNRLIEPHPLLDFMGTGGLQRVGLDGRKCLLKTICEANDSTYRNNYGLLVLPFRIFYPPPSNETGVMSAAQRAAKVGSEGKKDCGVVYPCLIDVLDVASYVRDWWFYSSQPYSSSSS